MLIASPTPELISLATENAIIYIKKAKSILSDLKFSKKFFGFNIIKNRKTNAPKYINIPTNVMETTSANGNKNKSIRSNNSNILVIINGEEKLIPKDTSILKLLDVYKINRFRVVIELNKTIVTKSKYGEILLNNNDTLEIVTFVGGG